jgi:hypothetical protein
MTMESRPPQPDSCSPPHSARDHSDRPSSGPPPTQPSLPAVRYWCAHAWVEVLPDGTCFITPYGPGPTDTGTVAARTEAALATVAVRIEPNVPLVRTAAWTDPERWLPTLDLRAGSADPRIEERPALGAGHPRRRWHGGRSDE